MIIWMIIWWLFECKPLTQFRQAMLSQNTSRQACTRIKGDLGFVGFIAARWTLCIFMSAVTIIRTQVCELAIAVLAFETQKSLGLRLTSRLTFLTVHPQQWQQIRCFALRVRTWLFTVQVTEAGIMISKHFNKQPAKTIIVKACIMNERDGFIHLDMIVINVSASKIMSKQNSNSNDSSKLWYYNDLHVLNLLRQSKQSDNQSLRVNCHWFHAPASCFRNCCSFFDYLWAGCLFDSEGTLSLQARVACRERLRRMDSPGRGA